MTSLALVAVSSPMPVSLKSLVLVEKASEPWIPLGASYSSWTCLPQLIVSFVMECSPCGFIITVHSQLSDVFRMSDRFSLSPTSDGKSLLDKHMLT